MIQDKTIKDLTKEQRTKLYLYLHNKIFNKDSIAVLNIRRENIDDALFHDVIMHLLLKILNNTEDESENETEEENDDESDDESIVNESNKKIKNMDVIYDAKTDKKFNIIRKIDNDKIYEKN